MAAGSVHRPRRDRQVKSLIVTDIRATEDGTSITLSSDDHSFTIDSSAMFNIFGGGCGGAKYICVLRRLSAMWGAVCSARAGRVGRRAHLGDRFRNPVVQLDQLRFLGVRGSHTHASSGTLMGMLLMRMGGTEFLMRHIDYYAAGGNGTEYGSADLTCAEVSAYSAPYKWYLSIIETGWEPFANGSYADAASSKRHGIHATTVDELDRVSEYTAATGDVGVNEDNYIFPQSRLIDGVRHAFVVRIYVEPLHTDPILQETNITFGDANDHRRFVLDNEAELMKQFNFTRPQMAGTISCPRTPKGAASTGSTRCRWRWCG